MTGDDLQDILDALKAPGSRDGVKHALELLEFRRDQLHEQWEKSDHGDDLLLGRVKEVRYLLGLFLEK
jgi:hypothetical protein